MKLRTYLIKRTIHMIITLLIVLVLLFVLYRMMPGNAAAQMMMNPLMSPEQIEKVLVRYGFSREVEYPGEYKVTNFQPQTIGRYSVVVQATGDNGQTDSFETHFDVNAPSDVDYVAPQILDVGLLTDPPTIGAKADFYVWVHDVGGIRDVEVNVQFPSHEVLDNGTVVPKTDHVIMSMVDYMSDEANNSYYYSGTTTSPLERGEDQSANFTVTFEAEDRTIRNVATAAMTFNADTGLITSKIWNLTADIPYSQGVFQYPDIADTVTLSAMGMGASPDFTLQSAGGGNGDTLSLTGENDTGNSNVIVYTGTHVLDTNGMMLFTAEVGGISATFEFPVNSVESIPAPVQDDDSTYPLLSDLKVVQVNPDDGTEMPNAEYPFILSNLKLLINATAVDENGKRCANVTAMISRPDGHATTPALTHPKYVVSRSMLEQFVVYMKTMLVFDFGTSYIYQRPTWEVILERVPTTALLFGTALILSYILGILIGVIVAWRRGSALELGTIVVTLFFYSMPIFWFALIMQWVFYSQLHWFPLAGVGGLDSLGNPLHGLNYVLDILWHLTLPLVTLMILGLAGNILLMRSAMLEVIGEDFTVTARAKGLKERTVLYKHVARNAMLPVVTAMAMSVGAIISGGVLTETIFSWYGMGTLLIEGTLSKDFPVVQGAFYILALITILGNMAADILYAWLDPRVQL